MKESYFLSYSPCPQSVLGKGKTGPRDSTALIPSPMLGLSPKSVPFQFSISYLFLIHNQ